MTRWAWRQFRREWRQQLTILVLITVAVAAAVAGSISADAAAPKASGSQGDASALAHVDAGDRTQAATAVAGLIARFGPVEVVGHSNASIPGLINPIDLRAQDPHGLYGHSTLALVAGRYPTAADEVALTSHVADSVGASIGSTLTLDGVARRVVGRVENPLALSEQFALIPGGAEPAGSTWTVFLGSDHPIHELVSNGEELQHVDLESTSNDRSAVLLVVVAAITLLLGLVGLIAAAGFLVVAHRRQHQLGLVSAIGATEKQVRLVLLANGAFVGVSSAVFGGALGVAGWIAIAPIIERAADHRVDRFGLPWALLAFCLGLAVVASVAAAWWPARTLAKLPITAALSRRPPRPAPVHRSLVLALAIAAAGVVAIAEAQPSTRDTRPGLLVVGLLAVVLGTVLSAPSAIRALAIPARRLPIATRVALRDLARHQSRAGAALAAITLALAISVSVTVIAQASTHQGTQNLSDHQLLVRAGVPTDGRPVGTTDKAGNPLDDPRAPTVDASRIERVASVLRQPLVFTLQIAVNPNAGGAIVATKPVEHGFEGVAPAYVATPELLAHYGIDSATIDPSTELLTSLSDNLVLIDPSTRPDPANTKTVIQHENLSTEFEAPTVLITPAVMQRHGWKAVTAGWFIETPNAITASELATATRAAGGAGLALESHTSESGLVALGRAATIAGVVLALAILAMTIGLLRGEATGEMRTLTAVGAAARTRRSVTASAAGGLALVGALLSMIGAYVALAAAYRSDLSRLASPPMANLLFVAIGLPLLAAMGGWVLGGSDPGSVARQPS